MEAMILKSMLHYQDDFFEFLEIVTQNCFSKKGLDILEKMISLKEKEALSIQTLLSSLDENFKQSDYFLNFLSTEPNPNYLKFTQNFIFESKIKKQRLLADKLKNASNDNVLLDLSILQQELEIHSNDLKTEKEWIEELKDKVKMPQYPTKIDFLDSCFNGGFTLGQLMLISGDAEAGKTMLGLQILENLAKTTKVGFFCFEFMIENHLYRKQKQSSGSDNIIIVNDGFDIYEVVANIKRMYKKGARFFLIDSQMRLTTPQTRSMEEEESLKFSTLARLCHTLKIFVILIVQTAKGDKDNPMGSKKGGHEASITIRIEKTPEQKGENTDFNENERIIIVKKNKQTGKHFKEKVFFNPQTLTFSKEQQQEPLEVFFEDSKETMIIDTPKI